MKGTILFFILFCFTAAHAQTEKNSGVIGGNIVDSNSVKAIEGATVMIRNTGDGIEKTLLTDKDGAFLFDPLGFGYYSISIRAVGYAPVRIDSIYLRAERSDFNVSDIRLSRAEALIEAVTVYAEKPLFENKDGKMIFNASESALSNSSSTTELLKQTPLVSVDEEGKVLMRGKEVRILIDDKPVELDARQLQDLLESMPGSMIEKIEVFTTPPPQYANERGGVINIVTKKGRVGFSARMNANYGTRGEAGFSGNISYRRNKVALNFTSGFSYNPYRGTSYSIRQNMYADSSNFFRTTGATSSRNNRPNSRLSLDYELDKRNSVNLTLNFNANGTNSANHTIYSNINRFDALYKLSRRNIQTDAVSKIPSAALAYTHKGKNPMAVLRVNLNANLNDIDNNRVFYQQFLNVDSSFSGADSLQRQHTKSRNTTLTARLNYDQPLTGKFLLSVGGQANYYNTQNELNTTFLRKSDSVFVQSPLLSNDFRFHQRIASVRAALRYQVQPDFFITAGLQQEYSETYFDIVNNTNHYRNDYFSSLPFATLSKKWERGYNLTASYKRSIQRPGINQLNPAVDYADPYNTRFGNPYLQPYFSDNFDLGAGYWSKEFNMNVAIGYNALQQIYSSIRTLQTDGKTTITWENLSGRKEYEANFWGGVTISRKLKLNGSAGYIYNIYSEHDRTLNRFRNGGTLNSSLNGNYVMNTLLNISSNISYRRFANPQGTVRSAVSMNVGIQQRLFKKKGTISLSVVDPFRQQQNRSFTYGPNYALESFSTTNSRNIRIALSYTFRKTPRKIDAKALFNNKGH